MEADSNVWSRAASAAIADGESQTVVAMIYAHAICFSSKLDKTDPWTSLNAVVLEKWPAGLERVKKMALDLANARARVRAMLNAAN